MTIIEQAIRQPITVSVAVILSVLAGVLAFTHVPIQMTPTVNSVVVSVSTAWENASPNEIESDIISEQEKVLSDVTGLVSMTSLSQSGFGQIRLEFETGTDIDLAMQQVLQKLDEVPFYPAGVLQPVVEDIDPESVDYIAWIGLSASDPTFDSTTLWEFMDLKLKPRFERIKGVSQVGVLGAREKELQIRFDPQALANRGITYAEFVQAIQLNNQNFSGGKLADGKNDIRVRAVGRFKDVDTIKNLVIRRDQSGIVYLKDIAEVAVGYKELTEWVRYRGILMPYFNMQLQHGANLLETMNAIKAEIRDMNAPGGVLEQHARRLGVEGTFELVQGWDSSTYVTRAIDLVQNNILIGGILATLTLLLFLRSLRTIGVIAIAIPISIIASVVILMLLGRSINVVSLAGIAFAVGMVIDNAIVVIENIYRHLEMGKSKLRASVDGSKEVSGAVFAATLTTVVVFLPILFIEDSAGQLFRDIALAIMAAVGISFIVSILVIPTLGAKMLNLSRGQREQTATAVDGLLQQLPQRVTAVVARFIGNTKTSILVFISFIVITFVGISLLIPPLDYLPKGNRNLVFGILIPPPGYNLDQMQKISERMEAVVRPLWESTGDEFSIEATLRGGPATATDPNLMVPTYTGEMVKAPLLKHYFTVAWRGRMFQGAVPYEEATAVDARDLFNFNTSEGRAPDVFNFAFQFPLFLSAGSTGSAININLKGDNLDEVAQGAGALLFKLIQQFGPDKIIPEPANFILPTPELRLTPKDKRLQEMAMNRRDLGLAVAANGDGLVLLKTYEIEGELKDIKIINESAQKDNNLQDLLSIPLASPQGNLIDLDSIAQVERIRVPDQIKHVNRQRAITLQFTPPDGMPLEQALTAVNTIIAELKQAQIITPNTDTELAGSAGKLNDIKQALLGDGSLSGLTSSSLFLALIVIYLVMVVLFHNWFYPLVILVTVPLATLGGFIGLKIVHEYSNLDRYTPVQNLDILTIIGFVILAGVVVNNAILIVHQTLNILRTNQIITPKQAILQALETRVRPILMSTLTSIGGMLPLVLMPGAGSELYRGLGSVVVGGLLFATFFTLLLVPVILSIVFQWADPRANQTTQGDIEENPVTV